MLYLDEKSLIDSELPLKTRSHIVNAVYAGYELVTKIINEIPFLDSEYGKNNYGELRNSAVAFCISQKLIHERLPLTAMSVSNKRRNYNYIQMKSNNAIIHISQVKQPNSIPRFSEFRYENSFKNVQLECSMANDCLYIPSTEENIVPNYYMLLTHGCVDGMLAFVHLGIPNVGAKKWMYQRNLLNDPRLIELPDREEVEELLPKFKEFYLKKEKGNGEKF